MTKSAYLHPSQVEITVSGDEIADLADERADLVEALDNAEAVVNALRLQSDQLSRRINALVDRMEEERRVDFDHELAAGRQQADREDALAEGAGS